MKWRYYAAVSGIVCLVVGVAMGDQADAQPESMVIPLNQIWALGMPGTRNIAELEPDKNPRSAHGPLLRQIRRALPSLPKNKVAKPGFAVLGTGSEALREAHAILVEGQPPRVSFPVGSDISIVFFSHQLNLYVHVDQIRRRENNIIIKYRYVPHVTKIASEHLALIPLADLDAGTYQVKIVRSSTAQQSKNSGITVSSAWDRRVVCRSFSFKVFDQQVD